MIRLGGQTARVRFAFAGAVRGPVCRGPAAGVAMLLLLGLVWGCGGAAAEEPATPAGQGAAALEARCADEARELCPDLQPGRPFVVRCLQRHGSEVSQPCLAYLKHLWDKAEAHLAELRDACSGELAQLCPRADDGLRQARQCLRRHRAQLSDGCKAALSGPGDAGAGPEPKPVEGREAAPAAGGTAPG